MVDSGASSLLQERKRLPIWQHRNYLVKTVRRFPNCVIVSSTGTGKTTQLPQFLYDAGLAKSGMIAITQPRRIAAISVAHRVAAEMGRGPVGTGPVGYCVRFEDSSVPGVTRLRYMTDGMLLREAMLDSMLTRYAVVIVDEAHERSLNTEVLLGVLRNASQSRANSAKPLKIIVMSATIDPKDFVDFLGASTTGVVYVEGRQFPIRILNSKQPSTDYVSDAASTCIQMHTIPKCPPDRGFLIFLTGEEEICRCVDLIRRLYKALIESKKISTDKNSPQVPPISVFPLFAALPQAQQMKALNFREPGTRKVIVSTNIAETSITIPGIRYVIDCGKAKTLEWDSTTGSERLRITWVSKSQAWQRAGRAAREGAGVCLRLYTDFEYEHHMALHPTSQLTSAPLSGVLLNLLAMGVKNVRAFPWFESPKPQAFDSALHLLQRLGATSVEPRTICNGCTTTQTKALIASNSVPSDVHLTNLGRLMTAFPLAPRYARALCSAAHLGCLVEAIILVSMLYVAPVFYVPQERREEFNEVVTRFRHPEGDLASLVIVYRAYLKASATSTQKTNINNRSCTKSSTKRVRWCRENFLNPARMRTAMRVRFQLRNLVKSSGVGKLSSCGEDNFSPLAKAFFEVAFRDQVATLFKRRTNNPADGIASTEESFPCYRKLCVKETESPAPLLCIHPESSLYHLAVVTRCPPPVLLFLEAVDSSPGPVDSDNDNTRQRVMMRFCCIIPVSWLSSGNEEEGANWAVTIANDGVEDEQIMERENSSTQDDVTRSLSNDEKQSRKRKKCTKRKRVSLAKCQRLSDNCEFGE